MDRSDELDLPTLCNASVCWRTAFVRNAAEKGADDFNLSFWRSAEGKVSDIQLIDPQTGKPKQQIGFTQIRLERRTGDYRHAHARRLRASH